MYKLGPVDIFSSQIDCVKNLETSQIIPFDPANADYQAYLAWLAEGNEPEPADEEVPE